MAAADPNKKASQPLVGVTSGVSVTRSWIQVFERNERAADADKLTDQQIGEFMKAEFPGVDAVTFDRVDIARGKYNRGGFHKKDAKGRVVPPKIKSRQHGSEEDSADSRHSHAKKDAGQIADRIVAHKRDFKSHKK